MAHSVFKDRALWAGLLSSGLATLGRAVASNGAPPPTVPYVDLERYSGRWYEIAHLPLFFQRHCAGDTTATYSPSHDALLPLTVDNQCQTASGETLRSIGGARPIDPSNSKLKVTFMPKALRWLPVGWGDYWILRLDPEYQMSLVGSPNRRYLWLLSRDPHPSKQAVADYLDTARADGYDLSRLTFTPQNN